jgi:3-methyl-2-oxobutanoate hydroxymethyltransferase
MNIQDWKTRKIEKKKISMVTCYDYTSSRLLNASNVDSILVGDSAAMVMLGEPTTLNIDVQTIALFTKAVVRGAPNKFIVADLPFLSYRKDLASNMEAAGALMKVGAHAIKLEGAKGNLNLIQHLVESGIPVMGHLGLTPQSIQTLGGFKVQAKLEKEKQTLLEEALQLQQAGCFALVLECIPKGLAREVSQKLDIPTIGIGAGSETDGQVLVWQDLLGMNTGFKPKFLRTYFTGATQLTSALNQFHEDVVHQRFPSSEESYE